ncbi:MAG: hypothetical protein AB7U47_13200, partial [Variibacter sp.]
MFDHLAKRALLRLRRHAVFAAAALGLFALVVVPLAFILVRAVLTQTDGGWTFTAAPILEVVSGGVYWSALLNTLIIGAGETVIATAVGVPLAWLFAR